MRHFFHFLIGISLSLGPIKGVVGKDLATEHSAILALLDTNLDSAEVLASNLLSESLKEKDYFLAANSAYLIGYCNDVNNKLLNSGMRYYEALQYLTQTEKSDVEFEAKILISLGRITNLVGKNKDALAHYQKALNITRVDKTKAITVFNIGYLYYSQKEYDSALLKFFDAYESFVNQENYSMAAYAMNYIGLCHHYTKNYQYAREYFERMLTTREYLSAKEFQTYQGWALHNIGNSYFEEGKYLKAEQVYFEALEIKKTNADSSEMFNTLMDIGELKLKQGKNEQAIEYLSKAELLYRLKAHHPESFKVFDFLEQAYRGGDQALHEQYVDRLKKEYSDYIVSIQEIQNLNQGYQLDLLQQQVLERFRQHQNIQLWKARAIWMVPLFCLLAGLILFLGYKQYSRRRTARILYQASRL